MSCGAKDNPPSGNSSPLGVAATFCFEKRLAANGGGARVRRWIGPDLSTPPCAGERHTLGTIPARDTPG